MLLKTVEFDSNCSGWTSDREMNIWFLRHVENHVNDIIRHRGYIYLNQICEMLTIEWNPDDENPCIRNDGVDRFRFVEFEIFNESDNTVSMYIHRYD